jgi:hypothetical protein
MSAVAKKPGFNNASGSRNRRVNRFAANANRTDIRHKQTRDITIAFVSPDQITDSGNDLGKFDVGEFVDAELSVAQDGTYEVATVVAGQLDMVEQTITAEIAGPDIRIKTRNNRRDGKFS